jgi:hypothetical protein
MSATFGNDSGVGLAKPHHPFIIVGAPQELFKQHAAASVEIKIVAMQSYTVTSVQYLDEK